MYLIIAVIRNRAKLKNVLAAMRTVGIKDSVIFDSMGPANINHTYPGYQAMLSSSFMSISGVPDYKKTIFSLAKSEEQTKAAIEAVDHALQLREKPSNGLIFSVPILKLRTGKREYV